MDTVSVKVLPNTSLRECEPCVDSGQRNFSAKYVVADQWVCRRHLAKAIDAEAKKR